MKNLKFPAAAALVIATSILSLPAAAQVTVGTATPDNGNCYPIGCANGYSRYQQVYTANAFSSAFNIRSFAFFHTAAQPGIGQVSPGTYSVFFGTTTKSVNGLSTTFAANNTSALSLFATLIVPENTSAAPATFSIDGSTPFLYNPSAGNLLLDIQYSNTSAAIKTFFDMDFSGSGQVSRAYGTGTVGAADNNGLVTRFSSSVTTTTTPEPGSLVLLGAGLAGTIVFVRRRRISAS